MPDNPNFTVNFFATVWPSFKFVKETFAPFGAVTTAVETAVATTVGDEAGVGLAVGFAKAAEEESERMNTNEKIEGVFMTSR